MASTVKPLSPQDSMAVLPPQPQLQRSPAALARAGELLELAVRGVETPDLLPKVNLRAALESARLARKKKKERKEKREKKRKEKEHARKLFF